MRNKIPKRRFLKKETVFGIMEYATAKTNIPDVIKTGFHSSLAVILSDNANFASAPVIKFE